MTRDETRRDERRRLCAWTSCRGALEAANPASQEAQSTERPGKRIEAARGILCIWPRSSDGEEETLRPGSLIKMQMQRFALCTFERCLFVRGSRSSRGGTEANFDFSLICDASLGSDYPFLLSSFSPTTHLLPTLGSWPSGRFRRMQKFCTQLFHSSKEFSRVTAAADAKHIVGCKSFGGSLKLQTTVDFDRRNCYADIYDRRETGLPV